MSRKIRKILHAESLEPRCVLAAAPIITEFMASNDSAIEDGFGDDSDWIEIRNTGDETVDLQGYFLTDDADNLAKWTFTQSTMVGPGEHLVVFASGQNTIDPLGYQHTNFRLSAGGEYVSLTAPDMTVLSEFGEGGTEYPPQISDVSFGLGGEQILSFETTIDMLIPTNGTLGTTWTNVSFSPAANGFENVFAAVGYEGNPSSSTSYEPFIESELPTGTTSVYLRHEFNVEDASAVTDLVLNLLFDDGIVIYLNGQPIISQLAPSNPAWNSTATDDRADADVLAGVDFSLNDSIDLLQDGENVIAFHLLNRGSGSSDLLFVPSLVMSGVGQGAGFLATPTPGFPNSMIVEQGPIIRPTEFSPASPAAGQPVTVTAEILPNESSVRTNSVQLTYRSMFDDEIAIPMNDFGIGGDQVAGDDVYTAIIPGSAFAVGEMTRWYVTAEDFSNTTARSPRFYDPLNSPEYYGLVIPDPNASDDLPVLYWFVDDTAAAQTRSGTRASIQLLGEFYDNIQVDLHGQSTAGPDFPKKSFDFDANTGEKFRFKDGVGRASDFNLLTNYGDQTKIRHPLAYEVHRTAGMPTLDAFPISVHRNGSFFGLYDFVEEADEEFLERLGLDPSNALYKVNNRLTSAWDQVEQKTGTDPTRSDFQQVVDAEALSNSAGRVWDFDNLDIADLTNYIAANIVMLNQDFGHKNMFWYRDTSGTELWSVLPWDVDLSFGHQWDSQFLYFNDTMYTTGGFAALNDLFDRLYTSNPRFKQMFERRIRTLMDEMMGPNGTSTDDSWMAQQINARSELVADEAVQDMNRWGIHPNFTHTPEQAVEQLLDVFLPQRRSYLEGLGRIPDPHGLQSDITIGVVDFAPSSGNPQEQYVSLLNEENFAVDISGWTLSGGLEHTFKPGTVIPAGDEMFVTVDVPAFKQRSITPRGGQQRFLQGTLGGQNLSTIGGQIRLGNAAGETIDAFEFGSPGDFDSDGVYSCADVNLLTSGIAAGSDDLTLDMTGDGIINQIDLNFWLSLAGVANLGGRAYLPGDANLDGVVDASDFNVWNTNKFTANSHWCSGDFTADGVVDTSDFNIWNSNKFTASLDRNLVLTLGTRSEIESSSIEEFLVESTVWAEDPQQIVPEYSWIRPPKYGYASALKSASAADPMDSHHQKIQYLDQLFAEDGFPFL